MTSNEKEQAALFNREINDESVIDAMARANTAIQKVLPGRIAFAEKIMRMSDDDYLKAINEILARQKRGGLVL